MSRLLQDHNKSHIPFLHLDLVHPFRLDLPCFPQVPDHQEYLDLHGYPKNKHCKVTCMPQMFKIPPKINQLKDQL